MSIQASVTAVILNWNGLEDTLACIETLTSSNHRDLQIVVVDNGSDPPCGATINEHYPSTTIIQNSENLGFSGGCNQGVRKALEWSSDYVWLLNNDTLVEPNTLSYLLATAESDPSVGIVGSRILNAAAREEVLHIGARINPWNGTCHHLTDETKVASGTSPEARIDYVTGCSLLIKAEVIRSIGLLDERYFLYWEDADWCTRAARGGWKIRVALDSVVFHKWSKGLGKTSPAKSYFTAKNSLRFIAKHHPAKLPLAVYWWPRNHLLNHLYRRRTLNACESLRGLLHLIIGRNKAPEGNRPIESYLEPSHARRTTKSRGE